MTEYRESRLFSGYLIGDDGTIIGKTGKNLKSQDMNGYRAVCLRRDGKDVKTYVHILVCEAFHGPRPEGHEVAHGNGIRSDNRASNLRWATRAENHRDKRDHGTHRQGEDIRWAKLTESDVRQIRSRPDLTTVALAEEFGVTPGAITHIRSGRNWKHVR